MFNLLGLISSFNESVRELLIIAAIITIIVVLIKYPNGRIFVLLFLGISLVAFSVYAAAYLNNYYNAKGGIWGKIVGSHKVNQIELVDGPVFQLKNVSMTLDYETHYSASETVSKVVELDTENNAYSVYVNGVPCKDCVTEKDYAIAYYEYIFYDDDLTTVLMRDTLTLKFAFYSNGTTLTISTDGGAEAAKYWNGFFSKNVFEVKIDNSGYTSDSTIPAMAYLICCKVAANSVGDVADGWTYSVEDGVFTFTKLCNFNEAIGALPITTYTTSGGYVWSVRYYYYIKDGSEIQVDENSLMPKCDIELNVMAIARAPVISV